jgi:hypothetical protein
MAMLAGVILLAAGTTTQAADSCKGFGPQTPRDITDRSGSNQTFVPMAPDADALNLCNIHFHANAEHKGPGFSLWAGAGEHGGYKCSGSDKLTPAQLAAPAHGKCHGVKPGDTIEVHWVFTSCPVGGLKPGTGLKACSSEACANPVLRVESQVFLVVNDAKALDFRTFTTDEPGKKGGRRHPTLPHDTGKPVQFIGSTTGADYNNDKCSALNVTWSVRPTCAKVNFETLNHWCENNSFGENHAHGVRPLVTNKALLAPIR